MTTTAALAWYDSAPLARPLARAEGSAVASAPLPDWITTVAAVAAFLITGAASLFAWMWSNQNKAHDKELAAERALAVQQKADAEKASLAAAALAAAELQRVRQDADEKARARAEMDQAFRNVHDKLSDIFKAVHEFREDFNGQVHAIQLSAQAVEKRVAAVEQQLSQVAEESSNNHAKLNSLIIGLRTAGIVVSFDPNSSTGLVAVAPERPRKT